MIEIITKYKKIIYFISCIFIISLFVYSLTLQQEIEKNNKIINKLKTEIETMDIEINILNNEILNLTSIENLKTIIKQNPNFKPITKKHYININKLPLNKNL